MSDDISIPAVVSGLTTLFGLLLNMIYQNRKDKRLVNLQDHKMELEAVTAARAEGELIRKELRAELDRERQKVQELENEYGELMKRYRKLEDDCIIFNREIDIMRRNLEEMKGENAYLRRQLEARNG